MTGLISIPLDETETAEAQVVADDWFPPVKLARVRAIPQLGGGAITADQLTAAIEGAMLTAFRQLRLWRAERATAGAASLAAVTEATLNGRNQAEVLWERAITFLAAADLYAGSRDISATDSGLTRANEKDGAADEARREGYAALTDLLSIGGEEVQRNKVVML